jgi:hypothetical protein
MSAKKPAAENKPEAPKADAGPKAPAKAAPGHAERLDKLEADHAALRDLARANGWSLPE